MGLKNTAKTSLWSISPYCSTCLLCSPCNKDYSHIVYMPICLMTIFPTKLSRLP